MKITNPIKLISVWAMTLLIAIMLTSLAHNLIYEETKYVVVTQEEWEKIQGNSESDFQ